MSEPSPTMDLDTDSTGYFDIDVFIDCVKSRSVIWDTSHEEYKNRERKKEEWADICRVFHEDFDEKPDVMKYKIYKELQLKWKNIRDGYMRNLKRQKQKSSDGTKGGRQYVYAKQMEFLKNTLSISLAEDFSASDFLQSDVFVNIEEPQIANSNTELHRAPSASTVYRKSRKHLEENIQKCMSVMTKQTEETLTQEKDDDYNFLLSILPTIKKFSDIDRLKLRCDILQLIIKYKEQSTSTVQPTSQFSAERQSGLDTGNRKLKLEQSPSNLKRRRSGRAATVTSRSIAIEETSSGDEDLS
ncbi:uncharacterized protein LOC128990936 [Macrosteles quadrilineatus]|uniref:uncharacterized protein LOC128990936 n=1 Tax=Macrosteles quadrilineatus TaxID=74068 RepID=UPI0023E155A8|nr:uncharacterized protein LOC128990936 [Macrosteles quadrilineatus]